jgi:hypothetical protein
MKRHILFFHSSDLTEEEVVHFFNARADISDWVQLVSNVYVFVSEATAWHMQQAFHKYLERNRGDASAKIRALYAFFGVNPHDANGFLAKGVWDKMYTMADHGLSSGFDDAALEDEIPF